MQATVVAGLLHWLLSPMSPMNCRRPPVSSCATHPTPASVCSRRLRGRGLTMPGPRCCASRPSQRRQTRSPTCVLLFFSPVLSAPEGHAVHVVLGSCMRPCEMCSPRHWTTGLTSECSARSSASEVLSVVLLQPPSFRNILMLAVPMAFDLVSWHLVSSQRACKDTLQY